MDKKELIQQYHPAFCAAMELEFRDDKDHLTFEKEYNLNSKPNEMDLLIINNDENVKVKNGLGAIFRKHNIFEFKSPNDILDVKIYHRTMGYANLYVAYEEAVTDIDEITISFIRERYPRKLMKWFLQEGFTVDEYDNGIYHISKTEHIDMQIIVTSRLDEKYTWINKLTPRLVAQDIMKMRDEMKNLDTEGDLINAESVMDLSISLNADKKWIKELMGMGLLKEMMEEERKKIREEINEELKEERKKIREELNEELNEERNKIREEMNEELKEEKKKNSILQKELDDLRKQMSKIAML